MPGMREVMHINRAAVMEGEGGVQDVTLMAGVIRMKTVVVQTVVEIQNALIIQVVIMIWYVMPMKIVLVRIVLGIQ
jgi:hypothetical protein